MIPRQAANIKTQGILIVYQGPKGFDAPKTNVAYLLSRAGKKGYGWSMGSVLNFGRRANYTQHNQGPRPLVLLVHFSCFDYYSYLLYIWLFLTSHPIWLASPNKNRFFNLLIPTLPPPVTQTVSTTYSIPSCRFYPSLEIRSHVHSSNSNQKAAHPLS